MKKLKEIDTSLFLKIYSYTQKSHTVEKIAVTGTKLSYYIFFALYMLGIIYVFKTNPSFLFKFLLIPATGLLINTVLRKICGRQRPINALGIETSIEKKKSNSFPSNHSASAMVITVAFMAVNMLWGLCLVPLALLTGLSRIASGVHFPLDVLAGLFVGGFVGYVGFFIV